MLSDEQIEAGKRTVTYGLAEGGHHEHPDCIRIAYHWLDAQTKIKGAMHTTWPIKHLIERWAGRYVSQTDVEVAAHLHPAIRGKYPYFNISSRLTRPNDRRLASIGQAKTQSYAEGDQAKTYATQEP